MHSSFPPGFSLLWLQRCTEKTQTILLPLEMQQAPMWLRRFRAGPQLSATGRGTGICGALPTCVSRASGTELSPLVQKPAEGEGSWMAVSVPALCSCTYPAGGCLSWLPQLWVSDVPGLAAVICTCPWCGPEPVWVHEEQQTLPCWQCPWGERQRQHAVLGMLPQTQLSCLS